MGDPWIVKAFIHDISMSFRAAEIEFSEQYDEASACCASCEAFPDIDSLDLALQVFVDDGIRKIVDLFSRGPQRLAFLSREYDRILARQFSHRGYTLNPKKNESVPTLVGNGSARAGSEFSKGVHRLSGIVMPVARYLGGQFHGRLLFQRRAKAS